MVPSDSDIRPVPSRYFPAVSVILGDFLDTRASNLRLGDAVDRGKAVGILRVRGLVLVGTLEPFVEVTFDDESVILYNLTDSVHLLEYERRFE